MSPKPGKCPLTDEDAQIADVEREQGVLVICQACGRYVITHNLRRMIERDKATARHAGFVDGDKFKLWPFQRQSEGTSTTITGNLFKSPRQISGAYLTDARR